jgi:antirestriction protein ArdC
MNPTTDKPYRGGNAVHLLTVGFQKNYDDPRWMTYKQAVRRVSRITGAIPMDP